MFTKLEIYVFYIITDDNIIQFGDVQVDDLVKKTGSIVYLQYIGGKHIQNDWYCTASTTSSHNLQVSAVDVRFQRYGVSTGNCDLGQKSYLYISDNKHSNAFRCEEKTILGNYDTMFNSTKSKITIHLHLDGDPQFVWIAVSGMSVTHLYYLFIYLFITLFIVIIIFCYLLSYFVIYYTFTMSVDISSSR